MVNIPCSVAKIIRMAISQKRPHKGTLGSPFGALNVVFRTCPRELAPDIQLPPMFSGLQWSWPPILKHWLFSHIKILFTGINTVHIGEDLRFGNFPFEPKARFGNIPNRENLRFGDIP